MMRLIVAAALLLLSTSSALAERDRDRPRRSPAELAGKLMKRFDHDRDGRITRDEAKGARRLARHFDRIDANRDGALTQAEIQAAIEKRREND